LSFGVFVFGFPTLLKPIGTQFKSNRMEFYFWAPTTLDNQHYCAKTSLLISPHNLGNMIFELLWNYKDISPNFIADFLVQGTNLKPTLRNDKLRLVPRLAPTFVVLSCVVKERCFKGSDLNTGVASCYDLVLMDASKACFAARLNSGLTKKLHGYNVLPGASFTVKDYDMILLSHDFEEPILNRMVMFVKDFEWQTAPSANHFRYPEMAASDEWTTDTFQKANFDFDLVCDVERTKCVRMFNWTLNKNMKQWNYFMLHETGVKHGYWIWQTETKIMWVNQLEGRKKEARLPVVENNMGCTCLSQYDLRKCVLTSYPITKVCKEDLYGQVLERVGT
jgi:hypothetical protein